MLIARMGIGRFCKVKGHVFRTWLCSNIQDNCFRKITNVAFKNTYMQLLNLLAFALKLIKKFISCFLKYNRLDLQGKMRSEKILLPLSTHLHCL